MAQLSRWLDQGAPAAAAHRILDRAANGYSSYNYFFQRDVLSDDPFTEEVEPSVPFNLAAMVQNIGPGEANNVSIKSAQPKIIENEKGLLIDFQIIASEVDGQNMSRL